MHCLHPIEHNGLRSRATQLMRQKALADPQAAVQYAEYAIQGRWPEGEPIIAQGSAASYKYATVVLDGRFEAGEPAILTNGDVACDYAMEVMKKEWPEAEDIIFTARNPGDYYDEYLRDEDYDNLPDSAQQWLIRENGECGGCGKALPAEKRDRWHLNDGFGEEYCSERCADKASEFQHESDLEFWTEDLMTGEDPERVIKAVQYIQRYHKWLEDPDDVKQALIDGDFLPDDEEEE